MRIKCLVIDDEKIAREGIADYISDVEHLELVGLCKDALEANNIIAKEKVDLIFLDVQMPRMSGLDFVKAMENPPLIIVCTAYPSYALEGYELNVLDYLVKPITFPRFLTAVNKAKSQHELLNVSREDEPEDFFFIKSEGQFVKIIKNEILYVEAMENYSTIHTIHKKYISLIKMKTIEGKLKDDNFFKTHRSYIVSLSKVTKLEGHQIFIGEKVIPVSRNLKNELYDMVIQGKLLKK